MSDLASPKYLRVSRENLYSERDPHAAERRTLVAQYPGLALLEAEPIELIRSTVEMNSGREWLQEKQPASRYAELFEAPPLAPQPPPAPKAAKPSVAQLQELERMQLACLPWLGAVDRQVILAATDMHLARFVPAQRLREAAVKNASHEARWSQLHNIIDEAERLQKELQK